MCSNQFLQETLPQNYVLFGALHLPLFLMKLWLWARFPFLSTEQSTKEWIIHWQSNVSLRNSRAHAKKYSEFVLKQQNITTIHYMKVGYAPSVSIILRYDSFSLTV